MSLNIITVTLSMETTNFLGISIVGQTHRAGDGGIYVGTIMPGGAVAQDGRIEPGDMILQVNEYSFENMSNDDAVRILRDVVNRPGPIKLVVAKCWNPNPQSYFTLPKGDPSRPQHPSHPQQGLPSPQGPPPPGMDPTSWVEQARLMAARGQGGPMSPSLASVTSDGSSMSSLPESNVYPGRTESTNFLLPPGGGQSTGGGTNSTANSTSDNQGFNGAGTGGGGGGGGGLVNAQGAHLMHGQMQQHQHQAGIDDITKALGSLSTSTDVMSILRAMQHPSSGLEIKDRMWLKITIPNAFLGHSLVDWLYDNVDGFSDRRDARKYASRLLKENFVRHTTGKASFSEQCYYIFNSDFSISNMNNLSHPSVPYPQQQYPSRQQGSRDPVEVDEENDTLAPLPAQYQNPWSATGSTTQYLGYQPRTAGYQQPSAPGGGRYSGELDTFGPGAGSGHSSPGSSNSSNRSAPRGMQPPLPPTSAPQPMTLQQLNDSMSDLDHGNAMHGVRSYRGAPSIASSNEFFVDPM